MNSLAFIPALLVLAAAGQSDPQDAAHGARPDTVSALLACRDLAPGAERAQCLETRSEALAAALDAGDLIILERESVTQAERETFGGPGAALGGVLQRFARTDAGDGAGETVEVDADGVEYVRDASGDLEEMRGLAVESVRRVRGRAVEVRLADGQVWRQTDERYVRIPRDDDMAGLTAELRRGFLGSFFMTLSHEGRAFRAERVD